jgi:hypothetical protein
MRQLALSPRPAPKIPNTSQQSPSGYPPRNALWSMLKGVRYGWWCVGFHVSLRQPTKPRANIIPRYAPILILTPLGIFAVDNIAKPLQ